VARPVETVPGDQYGGEGIVARGGRSLALATLCTLLFLTFLDNTVVSVALGDVQTSLMADVTDLQWVVGAYALTFASLMLACGMIGDELGRKKVMLAGAGVFCAGSVLSALAPNVGVLIAGRAVMGMGAAASEPGTLSMLRHLYPESRARSRAIGIWAGTSGLALAMGPVVGGVLVGVWSWRGIFWFNLSAGFGGTDTIALLCASAVLLVAFVWRERRAAHPLLDLRFLRIPQFTTANIVAFCTYFSTFAIFFFTALYLVEVPAISGYQLALVFLPMTALMILASVLAGRWTVLVGSRWSITIGCLLLAVGLFLTQGYLSPHPSYGPLIVALTLAGIGIGTTVVPITSSVLSAVPPERSGMAASATNTSREIGAVTGVAILGSLVYSQLHASLVTQMNHLGVPVQFQGLVINAIETGTIPKNTSGYNYGKIVQEVVGAAYTAFHDGLRAALYLSAALALAAALLALITLRSRPVDAGS